MLADLRLAARFLSRAPLFALGVIGLLALGVAANVVIFSLVDALLLRPLPVRDPERLVALMSVRPPLPPKGDFLYEEYESWRKDIGGFEDLLAWSEHSMFVRVGDVTERGHVDFVTDNLFSALGTGAARGRVLRAEDQRTAGTAPVVLSHAYWQRRFGGDPSVVGRSLRRVETPFMNHETSPRLFEPGPHRPLPALRIRPDPYRSRFDCTLTSSGSCPWPCLWPVHPPACPDNGSAA
jgi:putative ABC transport system permease protein